MLGTRVCQEMDHADGQKNVDLPGESMHFGPTFEPNKLRVSVIHDTTYNAISYVHNTLFRYYSFSDINLKIKFCIKIFNFDENET